MKMRTKDIILCALFAALMGIGANVAPFLTIGSVPITFQLLFISLTALPKVKAALKPKARYSVDV